MQQCYDEDPHSSKGVLLLECLGGRSLSLHFILPRPAHSAEVIKFITLSCLLINFMYQNLILVCKCSEDENFFVGWAGRVAGYNKIKVMLKINSIDRLLLIMGRSARLCFCSCFLTARLFAAPKWERWRHKICVSWKLKMRHTCTLKYLQTKNDFEELFPRNNKEFCRASSANYGKFCLRFVVEKIKVRINKTWKESTAWEWWLPTVQGSAKADF